MHQLVYTDPESIPVNGIYQIPSKDVEICIRKGRQLFGYQYRNSKWKKTWGQIIFQIKGEYSLKKYSWMISDKLLPDRNVIIIQHPNGVQFHQINPDKSGLTLLSEDGNFHEVYGLTVVIFGSFYPNKNYVGVMSRNRRGEIKFYTTMEESFEEEDPLFLLDINSALAPEWHAESTDFFVAKLYNDDRDVIGLRTKTGLEFFEFNDEYKLQSVVKTSYGCKVNDDVLFFANITGSKYQDIVVLNEKGLHVYSYEGDYVLRSSNDEFAKNGWLSDFRRSIMFTDLNNDGRDDLVFTGSEGLKALMFDLATNKWTRLLGLQELNYGYVVGTLPSILPNLGQPSIFIEDSKGNLRWSSVKYSPIQTTTSTTTEKSTTTARYHKILHLNEMERKEFTNKPILRWAEQLDSSFLKESVNMKNGHVGLSIPLVDVISLTGWKVQLSLSYSSQSQISEILGIEWYLPIAQDYVFVDYQGSIFPNDATYYLTMQGSFYRLKMKSKKGDITTYGISEDDNKTEIEYHRSKDLWMINGTREEVTFGKANDYKGQDAVAYGLTWPNWRFSGRDQTKLKRIVTKWYLNKRYDKNTEKSLYYYYEREDGNISGYTLAFRLKTITDGFKTHVDFKYASKNQHEYKVNTTDNDGNINLPLLQAHTKYLEECNIDNYNYKQTLKFQYEIKNNKRLLTGISQILSVGSETVFKFSYEKDFGMLKNCKLLPHDVSVDYEYDFYTEPSTAAIHDNVIKYPDMEKPKIGYGNDYSVLGHVKGGNVNLNILNRDMTHVTKKLTCPKIVGDIKYYAIQAYDDAFFVLISTEHKKWMYIYNRRNKKNWSDKPVSYSFHENDKLRFNKNIIAVAKESSKYIELYNREDDTSDWKLTSLSISRNLVYLTNHQKTVIGYDNESLMVFYLNEQLKWNKKILGHFPQFESNSKNLINRFDLKEEMKNNLIWSLQHGGLQMFNNFIVLNELKENNGQLYFNVHLLLLNEEYSISNSRNFVINRENIYGLKHEFDSEDKKLKYVIGYVNNNGIFSIRAKDVYGEGIRSIRNKNRRYDTVEEMKKGMNDNESFKKSVRDNVFLLDWSKYHVQITQEGIQIGDVFLRLTGADWERTSNPTSLRLGDHFKLESNNDKKQFKLYKNGQVVREMNLYEANQIMNRYPAYMAYHPRKDTIRLITFKDDENLGEEHTFNYEQFLSMESDLQNLVTVYYDEVRIRPVSTLKSPEKESYVRKVILNSKEIDRATGYKHSFDIDKRNQTYSEIISVIPGDDEKSHGRYESIETYDGEVKKKIERWFNPNNEEIYKPEDEVPEVSEGNQENESLLLDRTSRLLISDFSPYNLKDETCGYYGFESYEKSLKHWNFNKSHIKKGFAFTGENYLEIIGQTSTFEGKFIPADQETTYLATCWIRSRTPLQTNTAVPYLKALVKTENGDDLIGLKAQVKLQSNDWYYLELPIDFQILKKIYEGYLNHKNITGGTEQTFQIVLRVEGTYGEKMDLDHVRFTPFTFDFQATVYHPVNGKSVAVLQYNGLVTRTIYNRRHEEIAIIQENNILTRLTSTNKIGNINIIPSPKESPLCNKPSILIFEPESGLYEDFSLTSFQNNWELNDDKAWMIAPGQLWHNGGKHKIKAKSHLFDKKDSAIRFYYYLDSQSSIAISWRNSNKMEMVRQNDAINLKLPDEFIIRLLPVQGEIIVMVEKNYMWVWLNALLLFDRSLSKELSWDSFELEVQGKVVIEDFVVINRPKLKIQYYNSLNEKIQTIQMEDANTVKVTEILYDEIGREAITTKTSRVKRSGSLLHYRTDFVLNKNPKNVDSVFKTGIIKGLINELNPKDKGYPYSRTEFALNPLGETKAVGLPGKDFSVTGPYSAKFSTYSDIAFLDLLFPIKRNYRQKVESLPNGTFKVSVFDKYDMEIARYVKVPSHDHLLSTYDYDKDGNLIKILPPAYHEKADTYSMLKPWSDRNISPELEDNFGTFFKYDKNGNLIRKITPDDGITEYLYNSIGLLRFTISLGKTNRTNRIIYYKYDENSQLTISGSLTRLVPVEMLREYVEKDSLPYAEEYQEFDYSDDHLNPLLRGKIKHCITHNDELVIEKLKYDAYDQVVEKTSTILLENENNLNLKIERNNGKVRSMTYPVYINDQPFVLTHTYNKLGQLVGLGTPNDPNQYVRFTYYPTGELSSESYKQNYTRNYYYNSPGFLKEISDPFLTENIEYTDLGYGQKGFGDGMVMRTVFQAHWTENADDRWFQIRENDTPNATCLRALKESGYVNNRNRPVKLYNIDLADAVPLICKEQSLAAIIAQKQAPQYYGHSYSYGNHQELIKAKYFTSDSVEYIEPLKYDSFSEIKGISKDQSKDIWELLTKEEYVINDKTKKDELSGIGKRGKSFFRPTLYSDLKSLNDTYGLFARPIEKLIIKAISEGKTVTLEDFESAYSKWQGIEESTSLLFRNYQKNISKEIGEMLAAKNYIQTNVSNILDTKFKNLLSEHKDRLADILKILYRHFAYQLGESPFDVESYDIDANGNHKLFYTGYNRYEFTYKNFTNKIYKIKLNGQSDIFKMEHDEQGNVIKAGHKGISHIKYYPASQRPSLIHLDDGRTLRFSYDAQGERILKRVFDSDGKLNSEIRYHRDEQGRVLVDRKITYSPTKQDVVTVYLYGPRGLLGFIRNNKFYNVMTDHAGSVRLVVQNGRVVAAYDYLPYGQMMRSYGYDTQAHITYRYTGQEWDEETGLYNYHARLYDPAIGRFYQIDPKAQYFSPYVYAGNSPLSVVDPDGELAFLLVCIFFAVSGAYLGGAAANNRWNPADWDWEDPATYLGALGGAIAGGLMPIGAAASVAAIGIVPTVGLGLGGLYFSTAAANGDWNPTKWKYDRPVTWNAMFQGFGMGSGLAGGIGVMHKFAKEIANCAKMCIFLTKMSTTFGVSTKTMKTIFLTVSYGSGGGIAYVHGAIANDGNFAFWQWDFTDPNTWSSLIDGFDTGSGLTQNFLEVARGVGKLSKNHKAIKALLKSNPSKRSLLKGIVKNVQHPLSKVAGSIIMGYFMGASAAGEFDITKWSLSSFSTYEGILNGVFFGKDTRNMLKYARMSKTKNPFKINKTKLQKWTKKFSNLIDNVLLLRQKFMYRRAISDLFSNPKKTYIENLRSQSSEIERFLKNGYEKWKDGSNKPPKELKGLISEEIKRKVDATSDEPKKWRDEANELNKEKNEIYPDRDVDYLNCRKSRRRKRNPGGSCYVPIPNEVTTKKRELIQHFLTFDDPGIRNIPNNGKSVLIKPSSGDGSGPNVHEFDPNAPKGFTENFSLLIESTPNILAVTKSNFFVNTILGSLLTLPNIQNDKLAPVRRQQIFAKHYDAKFLPPSFGTGRQLLGFDQVQTTHVVKTGFMTRDSDSNKVMVLKTFVIEPRVGDAEKITLVKDQLDIKSKFSQEELNDISGRFGIEENDYRIEENIFYIKNDKSLEVQKQTLEAENYVRHHLRKVESHLQVLKKTDLPLKRNRERNENLLSDFVEKMGLNPTGDMKLDAVGVQDIARKITRVEPKFKEITVIPNMDLDPYLRGIQKNDVNEIKKSMDGLLDRLLNIYHSNAKVFNFKPRSESDFHAFVYGALTMNFKRLYDLDIRVEAISGRGNADLMFMCRLDSSGLKNWHAIPILVEFKADKTGPKGARDQIVNTGYLYNMGLKTVANKAVIVGANSNAPPPKIRTPENSPFDIDVIDIPRPEGFAKQSITNPQADSIIKEMKHLYYSISPLAIKTEGSENNHYLSKLILGELLSRNDIKIHVQNYKNTKANGKLTTYVFKDNNQWVILNIVESSKAGKTTDLYKYDKVVIDDYIKLPNNNEIDVNNLIRIDIEANSRSKIGWSKEEIKRSDIKSDKIQDADFFFQGVNVKRYDGPIVTDASYKTLDSVNADRAYSENTQSTDRTEKIIKDVSKTLEKIPGDIESESDFQAVLQGIFLQKEFENGIVRVLPEANPSKAGRIDIALIELETDVNGNIFERSVILMELKYAKGDADVKEKLKEAKKQVIKYNSNLRILTDSPHFLPIAAVYDAATGKIIYEKLPLETIQDPSQILSDHSSQNSDDHMSVDEYSSPLTSDTDLMSSDELLPAFKKLRTGERKKRFVDLIRNETCYENETTYDLPCVPSSAERALPWMTLLWRGLHQFMEGITWNQDSYHPVNNDFTTTEYTPGHFQGLLQLIDFGVRKFTGQKYPRPIITRNISLAEASIKAWELTEEFHENLNRAMLDLEIDLSIVQSLDGFTLKREIAQKLVAGEAKAVLKIFQSEIRNMYNIVVNSVGREKADRFLEYIDKFASMDAIDIDIDLDEGINQYEGMHSFNYPEPQIFSIDENVLVQKMDHNNSFLGHRLHLNTP